MHCSFSTETTISMIILLWYLKWWKVPNYHNYMNYNTWYWLRMNISTGDKSFLESTTKYMPIKKNPNYILASNIYMFYIHIPHYVYVEVLWGDWWFKTDCMFFVKRWHPWGNLFLYLINLYYEVSIYSRYWSREE